MDTSEVCEGEEQIPLPGFRFHPTDEELVSFYLRRKVEKRGIKLELIKQMDIYKHNPWDLPYGSSNLGEKEWYFYCKRGRKYKNSIRPNRVTGSGFWKATGIDKPVYSNDSIIGLKKTLVYYRGTAGKGSKTDWMMHEFRLPPPINISNNNNPLPQPNSKNFAQEAEIWTLCRIFKRNVSGRRYGTNWNNKLQSSTTTTTGGSSTVVNNNNHDHDDHEHEKMSSSGEISYINFRCHNNEEMKPLLPNNNNNEYCCYWNNSYQLYSSSCSSSSMAPSPVSTTNTTTHQIQYQHTNSNQLPADVSDFFTNSNWDELRSVVDMF